MTSHTPLPPHLDRFVREQVALGRFPSESDVIRAALHLLEQHSPQYGDTGPWLRQESIGDTPRAGREHSPAGRHSPRGLLADLRSGISFDEIQEARSEMWSGFPRGTAG